MAHEQIINDRDGNAIDVRIYCSDRCHQTDSDYSGWNGCLEQMTSTYCDACGVFIPGIEAPGCKHQASNVQVNRFPTEEGERCPCGNWIQRPQHE